MTLFVRDAVFDKDIMKRIAQVTGRTPKAVLGVLSNANEAAHVRAQFRPDWPETLQALADITATTALKLGLDREVAAALDLERADVEEALLTSHGATHVKAVFESEWPQDEGEEEGAEEEEGEDDDDVDDHRALTEGRQRLAATFAAAFSRGELWDIAVTRLEDTDVTARSRPIEIAEELVRYRDPLLRDALEPMELRLLLKSRGLAEHGPKTHMFRRLLDWAEAPSAPTGKPSPTGMPVPPPTPVGSGGPRPTSPPAPTVQKIKAFLVGNQDYESENVLHNPRKDVKDLSALLGRLGHDVAAHYDLRGDDMKKALRVFKKTLSDDDGVLFYFSGHGLEHHGKNWLLPIDFGAADPDELEHEAVSVDRVLAIFDRQRFRVCILDACRYNSYPSRMRGAGGSGLGQTQLPDAPGTGGTMICYATAAGKVASDGARGANGAYTGALLACLVPGRRIEDVMKDVRKRLQDLKEEQVPWEHSSLTGDWYPAGKS